MKGYVDYLLQIGYSSSSIRPHVRFLEVFKGWLAEKSIKAEECKYPEMIHFIDDVMIYYTSMKNPNSTTNRMMVSLAAYYDFLITRNKVILGLLIFQGLSTGELHRLRVVDIRLRKGTMFIREGPSGYWKKGSTARELKLEALQIIDLIDYIDNFRPRILCGTYKYLPGRKPNCDKSTRKTDQLLLSVAGSPKLKNSLHHLFKNLSEINPKVKNATQIRQSIIAIWLKQFDIRTVQYMSGHRFVSSTEYYKQINIEQLKRRIDEYHPLK